MGQSSININFILNASLTLACLFIKSSHQQINIILNLICIIIILFLSFFSLNDIQLVSFFLGIIYSGGLLISFMFVIMILDVNIFNIRNKLTLIIFSLFINQQVYNSFSFYLFSFSLSFLLNTRKIKIYMKDIMYELLLYLFTYNC